jgi:hypothetical protein
MEKTQGENLRPDPGNNDVQYCLQKNPQWLILTYSFESSYTALVRLPSSQAWRPLTDASAHTLDTALRLWCSIHGLQPPGHACFRERAHDGTRLLGVCGAMEQESGLSSRLAS